MPVGTRSRSQSVVSASGSASASYYITVPTSRSCPSTQGIQDVEMMEAVPEVREVQMHPEDSYWTKPLLIQYEAEERERAKAATINEEIEIFDSCYSSGITSRCSESDIWEYDWRDYADCEGTIGSLIPIDADLRDVLAPGVCPVYEQDSSATYKNHDHGTEEGQSKGLNAKVNVTGSEVDPYGIDMVIDNVLAQDFREILDEPSPVISWPIYLALPLLPSPSSSMMVVDPMLSVQPTPEQRLCLYPHVSYMAVLSSLMKRIPNASQVAYDRMIWDLCSAHPQAVKLREPIMNISGASSSLLPCLIVGCPATYKCASKRKLHMEKHFSLGRYLCPGLCGRYFSVASDLQAHAMSTKACKVYFDCGLPLEMYDFVGPRWRRAPREYIRKPKSDDPIFKEYCICFRESEKAT